MPDQPFQLDAVPFTPVADDDDPTVVTPDSPSPTKEQIGGYAIKRLLATGGMGSVYLARQEHPRRTVALKVMKPGVASKSALRRFEFESQILARLRHPNIAQVYEAGTHHDPTGDVPFFAMEYIPNARTIIEHSSQKKLGMHDRLTMFVKVCDAVHHGHLKGIIHRDLKPGNILVDSDGEPKIIDFGVARATDSDMTITTLQTDIGQLIGTLQYMSPEQCDADPHNLDTRSDVYSLGVVLYELLCERVPYDITRSALHEAARIIREQDPTRPSTIDRTLRGDLETIVLKALEKEREQRYRSAIELADDIKHYLHNEPITARRPTLGYQTWAFIRRNKLATGGVLGFIVLIVLATMGGWLALVIALTLGLAGTIWEFIHAARAHAEAGRQRDIAIAARRLAEVERNRSLEAERLALNQRIEAEEARRTAEREAAKSEAINNFLVKDLLGSADPGETKGRDITVREVLDNAARKIKSAFFGQPEMEAVLQDAIGMAYRGLGRHADAEPHLRAVLEIRRRLVSADHPDIADALNNLARLLYEISEHKAAEPLFREALEIRRKALGPHHPQVAIILNNLSSLLRARGDLETAKTLCLDAMRINRNTHGERHHTIATGLSKLALLHETQGHYDIAERLFRESLELQEKLLGSNHIQTAFGRNNLANLLHRKGDYAAAEPLLKQALNAFRLQFGDRHPHVLAAMNNLANLLRSRGDHEAAVSVFAQLLDITGQSPSTSRRRHASLQVNFGDYLVELKRYDEAVQQFSAAYDTLSVDPSPDSHHCRRLARKLVALFEAWDKPDLSHQWREKAELPPEIEIINQPEMCPDDHPYAGEQP